MKPLHYLWWLVSRASGVVALALISLSVLMGLAMAARAVKRPGLKRHVARLHEHVALVALAAIALHGLALLGDRWLKPGVTGIAIPFAMSYRPSFTGIGIIAGYLALLIGPSFYLRRRIGAARWRKLHRLAVLIWVTSAVHTIGAGSDASKLWLRAVASAPVVPVVYLLVLRAFRTKPRQSGAVPGGAARTVNPHSASAPIDTPLATNAVRIMPGSGAVSAKNRRVPGISSAAT
jgi:sulfoxide reductase heme-binding subunit YedZ